MLSQRRAGLLADNRLVGDGVLDVIGVCVGEGGGGEGGGYQDRLQKSFYVYLP